jgi:hypothetical protein
MADTDRRAFDKFEGSFKLFGIALKLNNEESFQINVRNTNNF